MFGARSVCLTRINGAEMFLCSRLRLGRGDLIITVTNTKAAWGCVLQVVAKPHHKTPVKAENRPIAKVQFFIRLA